MRENDTRAMAMLRQSSGFTAETPVAFSMLNIKRRMSVPEEVELAAAVLVM
jgi:hypothetical protein